MEQLDFPLDDLRRVFAGHTVSPEITDWDREAYLRVVSTELTPEQVRRVVTPPRVFPGQDSVLGIHWHPEFIPMDLTVERIGKVYPEAAHSLIIPTQHNSPVALEGFAGVEIDCFSSGFNRKVQLLLHFTRDRLAHAGRLEEMIAHTFAYRSSQLLEYLESLTEPSLGERLEEAALETGAGFELILFTRQQARKLRELVELYYTETPPSMLRNKLVESYFNELRALCDDRLINRTLIFLKAVKGVVKANFSNRFFYETRDMIEEARSRGAGIVIPHPEQFWPVLLADYDVDGFEVWNPQSREYTEFLIDFVNRRNQARGHSRRLLVFMGDDTHMSEKVMEERFQNREKAAREVGWQPAWEDPAVNRMLEAGGFDRTGIIEEYRSRLG